MFVGVEYHFFQGKFHVPFHFVVLFIYTIRMGHQVRRGH